MRGQGKYKKCVDCVIARETLPDHGHPCRPDGAERNRGSEADMERKDHYVSIDPNPAANTATAMETFDGSS